VNPGLTDKACGPDPPGEFFLLPPNRERGVLKKPQDLREAEGDRRQFERTGATLVFNGPDKNPDV
jgi:hypothetical protein